MKRSEAVTMMARYYGMKNVMVEQNYTTPMEFCSGMLELLEELGMRPPYDTGQDDGVDVMEWERE